MTREALAQPKQEPSQWREMVVVSLVREGINKHRARELADHFAAQRPWVGLTEEEAIELLPVGDWEIESTLKFAKAIETKLKEKTHDRLALPN